jgi:hypothetical protein
LRFWLRLISQLDGQRAIFFPYELRTEKNADCGKELSGDRSGVAVLSLGESGA